MATNDYKQLQVWQKSVDFVVDVYRIIEQLPKEEQFALANQLRRAAISIPSNIAEGQKRANKKETVQYTYIALGSLVEVETQLILVNKLYEIDVKDCLNECEIISRMLTALAKSLKRNDA